MVEVAPLFEFTPLFLQFMDNKSSFTRVVLFDSGLIEVTAQGLTISSGMPVRYLEESLRAGRAERASHSLNL
jgi:hypothetical protein